MREQTRLTSGLFRPPGYGLWSGADDIDGLLELKPCDIDSLRITVILDYSFFNGLLLDYSELKVRSLFTT